MPIAKIKVFLLVICTACLFSTAVNSAETLHGDAIALVGSGAHYRAYYESLTLWQYRLLTVEAGIGASAWGEQKRSWGKSWVDWSSAPSLIGRTRLSLSLTSMLTVYSSSWLSASFAHHASLLPAFHRVDLFTSAGISLKVFPRFSAHVELGVPIGWGSIPTSLGLGFSIRL